MTNITRRIEYNYDNADIPYWVSYYGCPSDETEKEIWAENFIKERIAELLTAPFKALIESQYDVQKSVALNQLQEIVLNRIEVVNE